MGTGEAHSEWLTRKQRIDPRLHALGWPKAQPAVRGAYRIEEYETDDGPADYALCDDSRVVGIAEAKKLSLGPQNVLARMVKHAARDAEPLTARDRAARAFDKLTAGPGAPGSTPDQQAWLDRIRLHLIENLSIDREDFDLAPVLEWAGGWTAADRVFRGKLAHVLREVNEAVAA